MAGIELYIDCLIKTLLAIVLGGLIGVERQAKNRPAGFRTHILVCLGSMAIMILSEYMFLRYYALYDIALDPTRMGAQVISGIGFLGAGTIIHYGNNVKGLTTAASLWTVAAVGLAIGAGFYFLALVITGAIYITLFMFRHVSRKINKANNICEMIVHVVNKPKALGEIQLVVGNSGAKILDMDFMQPSDTDIADEDRKIIAVHILIQMKRGAKASDFIEKIECLNGVAKVEKI